MTRRQLFVMPASAFAGVMRPKQPSLSLVPLEQVSFQIISLEELGWGRYACHGEPGGWFKALAMREARVEERTTDAERVKPAESISGRERAIVKESISGREQVRTAESTIPSERVMESESTTQYERAMRVESIKQCERATKAQRSTMKIKAALLVLDYNLYPRQHVDQQTVTHFVVAMQAGSQFPPVIVDKKSKRVVDGFHRTLATLRFGGEDAEIEVEFRSYANEWAMLQEAIFLNSGHGNRLSAYDMKRCLYLAEQFKGDDKSLAEALRITQEKLDKLRVGTGERRDGEAVQLKQMVIHLAGQTISEKQHEGIKRLPGGSQIFLVNSVIRLFEHNLLQRTNEDLLARLEHLHELIGTLLEKRAA